MDINQRKEQFSIAYVRAIASVAGYVVYRPEVDEDSVDLGIAARGGRGTVRSPRLELQIKCTARNIVREHDLRFPLEKKNYDDLRHTNVSVPRILVIVTVPEDIHHWITHTEEHLLLRHCGYWFSLRGLPEHNNETSVTLSIPRQQHFNVETLCSLMEYIGGGNAP